MSEDMLSKVLVRELPGLMRDFMKKIHGDGGQEWIEAFKLFLKKQNPWPATQKVISNLLEFVASATLDPVDRFSLAEVIKAGKIGNTEFWFSENFKRIFGSLVETDVSAATMRISRLKKNSVDGPIISELGISEYTRSFIAHIIALACRQGQGQEGVLLTNGWWNVFYVPDPNNPETFWAVSCDWGASRGRWNVDAGPVSRPYKWSAGSQVVSRDSGS